MKRNMDALLLITMQPTSSADAERLGTGLESLMREDPTITVRAGASPGARRAPLKPFTPPRRSSIELPEE